MMRSYVTLSVLLSLTSLTGCQSISPQEQHAADQETCSGYGYKPDSRAFADCMMSVDVRRQNEASDQRDNDAMMKNLSIRRNGDKRYPVCSASIMDANLDIDNNAWYGPNCREK
jgi:hypothetical protein